MFRGHDFCCSLLEKVVDYSVFLSVAFVGHGYPVRPLRHRYEQ